MCRMIFYEIKTQELTQILTFLRDNSTLSVGNRLAIFLLQWSGGINSHKNSILSQEVKQ